MKFHMRQDGCIPKQRLHITMDLMPLHTQVTADRYGISGVVTQVVSEDIGPRALPPKLNTT